MASFDEEGQVPQRTELHHQMDMGGRFIAINKGDDVRVVETLEDLNLRRQTLLQFLVELRQSNRFDSHESAGLLTKSCVLATESNGSGFRTASRANHGWLTV